MKSKCHLLVVNHQEEVSVKWGDETIAGSTSVDVLGVKIDNNEHVSKLCKKGNQKLHALPRISKYLSKDKLKIIMKTYILSQFNYCPLVWMFHNRTLNNKINKLHESGLRLAYSNDSSSFQNLLELDNSMSVHHRNLQNVATEMYKAKNNLSPTHMQDIFNKHLPLSLSTYAECGHALGISSYNHLLLLHLLISRKGKLKQQQARNPP